MRNKLTFKCNKNQEFLFEFKKMEEDYLLMEPQTFQNARDRYAVLTLNPFYCQFMHEGRPFFYYRHSNPDGTRFVGIIEGGDGPFDLQKGGYTKELPCPNRNDAYVAYRKTSDDPIVYSFQSPDGKLDIGYGIDQSYVQEGDILSFTLDHFPYVAIDHANGWPNQSVIYQEGIVNGTFLGKPFKGAGGFGKSYTIKAVAEGGFQFAYGNFNTELAGVRKDGRREEAVIDICFAGGVFAYYWLEGEEVVSSDEVEVETVFYHLPYMNDGTCMYKDIIFRFGGKEIHFEGKWGIKGFTAEPRLDKSGQAEVLGVWYEGTQAYEHEVSYGLCEIQGAFDEDLKKMGFTVAD